MYNDLNYIVIMRELNTKMFDSHQIDHRYFNISEY